MNAIDYIANQHKNEKAQRDFLSHCRRCMFNYGEIRSVALNAAEKAASQCKDKHRKSNAAVRAFNGVMLKALKGINSEDWKSEGRNTDEKKSKARC